LLKTVITKLKLAQRGASHHPQNTLSTRVTPRFTQMKLTTQFKRIEEQTLAGYARCRPMGSEWGLNT